MNWDEIKNVLMNIVSSIESLLQADEAESEPAAEQVMESINKAKALIEKIDKQEPDPKADEDEEKKNEEDVAKSITKSFDNFAVQLKKQLADNDKKTNDRIETIEKAFGELLEGFGIVEDKTVKETQPKQIQKSIDVNDFAQAFVNLLNQGNAGSQQVEKSANGLRGAVNKAFGGKQ